MSAGVAKPARRPMIATIGECSAASAKATRAMRARPMKAVVGPIR